MFMQIFLFVHVEKLILCTVQNLCAQICAEKKFMLCTFCIFVIFAELCAENLCTGRISAESRRKKFCARDFLCRRGFFVR